MTTLLPAECRFSPTVLSATIPSFHQPRAHCRVAVQDTPALPGYKVLGVLGRGGMATVYKVRQLGTKRLVAVKVIDRSLAGDEEIVARFRQEQALGARLRHPNLIAGYEAGRAAGRPYLVMELVEGGNLDELLGRSGPLPVAEACEVIRQAALGLQHLHEHGLVHRDVKPSNLMLTPAGEVKVLDLGLARHLHEPDAGERITAQGQFLGTLDYVAPEQCTDPHAVDIRADVYGLGCTLYELLAGQPPFARPRLRLGVPEDEGPRRGAGAADPGAPARCPRAARRRPGADAGQGPRGAVRQPRRRRPGRATLRGRCRVGGPGRAPAVAAA